MDNVSPTVPLLVAGAAIALVIVAAVAGYACQIVTRARLARKRLDEPPQASRAESPASVGQGASR